MNKVASQIQGVAMLVWSASLERPDNLVAMFLTAQACAALDQTVEMYFTARSVELLLKEHDNRSIGYGQAPMSLQQHLQQTTEMGVRLYACSQALYNLGLSEQALSPVCAGAGGVVQFAARCADAQWRSLVF